MSTLPPLAEVGAWRRLNVAARRDETPQIAVFDLVHPDGAPLPAFRAGAHLEVRIGEKIRHYSLCNSPQDRSVYRIAVQREPAGRGGSRQLCDTVAEGGELQVRGPFNHFELAPPTGQPPLLLAGGIGITPVLCMALELAAEGQDFELHVAGRSIAHMAFLPLLRSAPLARHVHLHADDGQGAPALDLATTIGPGVAGRHLYVCGPSGMIDATNTLARSQGWAGDHIHFERFGAPVVAPDAVASAEVCEPFEVEIASTGRRYCVPHDRSIVQVLAEHGVDIPVSCEAGVCGSCITRVIRGVPDHRDFIFSPEEQAAGNEFTPCCSRSRTPLVVLDL